MRSASGTKARRSGLFDETVGIPESMANQLEYKLEELSPDSATLAQYLNDESAEGWELVSVVEVDGDDVGRSLQHLVFRREQTNPTWEQPGA
jgi:hypothetical protein